MEFQQVSATLAQMQQITEADPRGPHGTKRIGGGGAFLAVLSLRAMVGRLASMVHGSSHSTATDVSSFGPRSTDPRVVPGSCVQSVEHGEGRDVPRWSPSAAELFPLAPR